MRWKRKQGVPLETVKEGDDDEEKEKGPEEKSGKVSTSTLSKAMKQKAPPPATNPKKSAPAPKTPAACSLEHASVIYSSLANKDGYLQAGVDDRIYLFTEKQLSI